MSPFEASMARLDCGDGSGQVASVILIPILCDNKIIFDTTGLDLFGKFFKDLPVEVFLNFSVGLGFFQETPDHVAPWLVGHTHACLQCAVHTQGLLGDWLFDILFGLVSLVVVGVNSDVMAQAVRHEVPGDSLLPHFFHGSIVEDPQVDQTLQDCFLSQNVTVLPMNTYWLLFKNNEG
jgi:hypothetical protein